MVPPSKKKKHFNKLDELLRGGASGLKVDVDKAIASTAHRLLREKIVFKEVTKKYDAIQQYQNKGFNILEGSKEAEARKRLAAILRSQNLTFSDLDMRLTIERNPSTQITLKYGDSKKKIKLEDK